MGSKEILTENKSLNYKGFRKKLIQNKDPLEQAYEKQQNEIYAGLNELISFTQKLMDEETIAHNQEQTILKVCMMDFDITTPTNYKILVLGNGNSEFIWQHKNVAFKFSFEHKIAYPNVINVVHKVNLNKLCYKVNQFTYKKRIQKNGMIPLQI